MTSERLAEIRKVLVTYRLPSDPNQQEELLRAAQDLYDLARAVRIRDGHGRSALLPGFADESEPVEVH